MQIAHVGLRNLRSYRTADLDLGTGTTLLSGDIGAGKTSLLYAIEMALFGFAEVDPGYLVRHGSRDAEVSLSLTDGSHRWELRRRLVRRSRKGRDIFEPVENSLALDGRRIEYSATELRRRTIELLGFPDNPNPRAHSDVWRWAVYLAQERMRDVLDPDSDARMETVRKALGVEQFRLAGENARGLARALQERGATLTEQASAHRGIEVEAVRWREEETRARHQISELEARERQLRGELGESRAELERIEKRRRELATAREAVVQQERLAKELDRAVDQERQALQTAREMLARLHTEREREGGPGSAISASQTSLRALRTRRDLVLRRLGELEQLRGQASGLAEQVSERVRRVDELRLRSEASRSELARVQTELTRLERSEPTTEPKGSVHPTLEELQAERARREEKRADLDRRLATARAETHELMELVQKGVCPRCHQPVRASDYETHRHGAEELETRLQDELKEASVGVLEMDAQGRSRLEFERLHDQWRLLDARRRDLGHRATTLQAQRTQEDGLREQLETERAALEERRKAIALGLRTYDEVRGQVVLVDRSIQEEEERARAAAARVERLAAIERRLPEVEAEIDTRQRNEGTRSGQLAGVLHQIEVGRASLLAPDEPESTWKAVRHRADELDRSLQGVLRAASEPRGKLAEMRARLDEVERRLAERDALTVESTRVNALALWVDGEFRNAMAELERRRLHQGRRQFERRFALYFSALVEDPSLGARVDESFAPWADIAGTPTPAEALSGGERTALALAYRLALGQMVREAGRLTLETLILDEPTEGFSQEQTLRMGDLLEGLGLPQVILVSHERQLEGIADRVVRIQKKQGISSIDDRAQEAEAASPPAASADLRPPSPVVSSRRRRTRRLTDPRTTAGDGTTPQVR